MSSARSRIVVSVTVDEDDVSSDPVPEHQQSESTPAVDPPGPPDGLADLPEVRVVTPGRVVQVGSQERPRSERSRSLGRAETRDVGSQFDSRQQGDVWRAGRPRGEEPGWRSPSGARNASTLPSRPATPRALNDGPPPVLPRPASSGGDPDAASVSSAPADLRSLHSFSPTAPAPDSQESLLRRYRLVDTLLGRIPERPDALASRAPGSLRERLVARLLDVNVFIVQPVFLSHRFQRERGEKQLVLDQWGSPLLFAVETERSALRRACCCCCAAHRRPFQVTLYDLDERPVAQFQRRPACTSCWSPCCLQRARLRDLTRSEDEKQADRTTPESEVFYGVIRQRWRPTRAEFVCSSIRGGVVLRVRGPARHPLSCCGGSSADAEFYILSGHGRTRLGRVAARWRPLDVDVLRRSDNCGVRMEMALPSRAKMTLLAATLLIDCLYYGGK